MTIKLLFKLMFVAIGGTFLSYGATDKNHQDPPCTFTINATKTDYVCFNENRGRIDVVSATGTAPYTYLWSNGATNSYISSVPAGTYSVVVTDSNGCTATESYTLESYTKVEVNATLTHVTCNGSSTGSIVIEPFGGSGTYTYVWTPSNQRVQNPVNLPAGVHLLNITDSNGCRSYRNFTITEPQPLTATATATTTSCTVNNGSAGVTVSGGTPPYTYLWSNGATTASISGLAAGTYTVTATDANLCSIEKTVTVNNPSGITVTTTKTDVSCYGGPNGTIRAQVTGGVPGYTYLWNTGATTQEIQGLLAGSYTVTVTDANNCSATYTTVVSQPDRLISSVQKTNTTCNNSTDGRAVATTIGGLPPYTYLWSTGATTQGISNLSTETYTVTVTDANFCSVQNSFTIQSPQVLSTTGTTSNITCFGELNGSVSTITTGGTPPYTYLWNTGETTADLNNIAAGTYSLTVTDANACSSIYTTVVNQPASLVTTGTVTNISCNGLNNGTASVTVTGGTAPYTYAWSNGATTANINSLAAGSYTLTVTDANICTATYTAVVTQPAALVATGTVTQVTCNGGSNGTASVTVAGGTAPYTYVWNNGATTANINGLAAGSYTVTVTDANTCTATYTAVVTQPAALSITSQPINQTVVNNSTVVFQVTAVNATTYTWYASTDGNYWSVINGAPFTGQDTASLTLTTATAAYNGYFVKVVINENTPCSITSNTAQLTVTNVINAVHDDYSNVSILEGDQITLGSVLNNDTLNGAIINPTEVVLSIEDANGINGLNIDATGSFAVPTNLPFGSYNFVYKVCEVENPNNCATATVYFEITENLKVKDINKNNVTVYPNPAQATIQFNIDKEISVNEIEIEIFDINGRLVMSKSLKNITDKIDIVNLASGAYIIQLNLDHKKIQKKFIKIN